MLIVVHVATAGHSVFFGFFARERGVSLPLWILESPTVKLGEGERVYRPVCQGEEVTQPKGGNGDA
jgi:hypothetical protein